VDKFEFDLQDINFYGFVTYSDCTSSEKVLIKQVYLIWNEKLDIPQFLVKNLPDGFRKPENHENNDGILKLDTSIILAGILLKNTHNKKYFEKLTNFNNLTEVEQYNIALHFYDDMDCINMKFAPINVY